MISKQKIIFTGILVALLASVLIVIQQRRIEELESRLRKETPSVSAHGTDGRLRADIPGGSQNDVSEEQGSAALDDAKLAQVNAELEAAQAKLDQLSRPLTEPMFSSVVEAELGMDEVLVLGGFQLENGNHAFTFLSPEPAIDADGRESVDIGARVFELTPEAIAEAGLDALATNAKNTLQHAEAWKKDDYQTTLERVAEQAGNDTLTFPTSKALSGQDVELSVGTISMVITIANRETEPGYLLTTRIEVGDTAPPGENPSAPD